MKIIALDSNHEVLIDTLRSAGFSVDEDYSSSREEVMKRMPNYQGMIIRSRFPIDAEFLSSATNLKFIGRVGAGLENIDLGYCKEHKVICYNAPEGNRDAVAEHAVGMLLLIMNRLLIANKEVNEGLWLREENRGEELGGKTVGIMGYGNMGKAFAQRLKGFGVKTICYDILANVGDENATQVSLAQFFKETEVLSLHTPLTFLTREMINSEFINHFEKPFYFINTARGQSVLTKDLVSALKSKKIIGACLDVLEYEKASFEKLFTRDLSPDLLYLIAHDQVILSPHIAGWTRQSKYKLAKVIAEKICKDFTVF